MRDNVWYRSAAAVNVPAWEDRGSLSIQRGTFQFTGKSRAVGGSIISVGRTQMGTNRWVHVRYDDQGQARDAYFKDGGALGWAGVLGGNKRLAAEFGAAAA
ncbi:hypothetical protein E1281_12415 [Actinomadura sp. KC345]|uniref:hypothetical protein n=1 Tax=Actinomadura sp. KC345 TaxID=2530371 RepID=UPI00104BA81B|nr:hypothetical protein [Actinomadura sp. KC345]TDC55455.1 hypothetical protein E1281_12415 [Actinomadura sp. KC345]